MTKLQELLEERIVHFLKARKCDTSEELVRKTISSLHDFYWKKVETIITENAPERKKELILQSEERLLVDMGVIHRDLIDGDSAIHEKINEELNLKLPKSNIFYLSEWLQYRWHLDVVLAELKLDRLSNQMTFYEESEYQKHEARRAAGFAKLKHIIVGMPGMNAKIFDTMKTNRLFRYLENAIFREVSQDSKAHEEELHMRQYFNKFLTQLQQRCLTKTLKDAYFDFSSSHGEICQLIVRYAKERRHEIKEAELEIENQDVVAVEHMTQNLHLLRSLINLGVTKTGTRRAFSPLFLGEGSSTKIQVTRLLRLVKEADPYIPGPPDILLAPYAGDGFFEWDRDTLVIPITTDNRLDVTFAHALAKYRILTDAMNFEGTLKKSWVEAFGDEDFQQSFVEAYYNWVFGVGQGHALAMDSWAQFSFFIENIGPNPSRGILPPELVNMNHEEQVEEIKRCRGRLNEGTADLKTIYHMAVLNWQRKNIPDAYSHIQEAHSMDPNDGRIHFAYAYISEVYNRLDAKEIYNEVIECHPHTIWKVYAEVQLDKPRL